MLFFPLIVITNYSLIYHFAIVNADMAEEIVVDYLTKFEKLISNTRLSLLSVSVSN